MYYIDQKYTDNTKTTMCDAYLYESTKCNLNKMLKPPNMPASPRFAIGWFGYTHSTLKEGSNFKSGHINRIQTHDFLLVGYTSRSCRTNNKLVKHFSGLVPDGGV